MNTIAISTFIKIPAEKKNSLVHRRLFKKKRRKMDVCL